MPAPGQSWPLDFKVVVCFFHTFAISTGIFRLAYRSYNSRFGWEDAWALLALLTDIGNLICSWLGQSTPLNPTTTDIILNWVATVTLTSVLWEARLSMIAAIIRITNPHAHIRRISYAIAIAFGLMWMAVLAQKLYNCGTTLSAMSHGVAISQLITDVISDVLLVVTPIFFLKGMKISRGQRVLLISSFASSIGITIVSIAHSIILFLPPSSKSLLIAHIKAALAVIICNLLIILTFAYRLFHKTDMDLDGAAIESEHVQFTSFVPGQLSLGSYSCHSDDPAKPPSSSKFLNVDGNDVSPIPTRAGS
ncbi:hypothetical protein J3R83DRAFT_10458 [Lanmaoa asiatica]|nr:hypothetical protein J3R83DRAFT_10458 [Lanmaoa asiatica]